jgi:probable F420-dependent oxidoreductase
MEVGLALPQFDFSVSGEPELAWTTVAAWARHTEASGLGAVWLADHLFFSITKYGGPPGEHFGYDPVAGLAALARVTERVRLGTLVLCGPLRPPAVLAKALAGVDVVSGGRLVVGVGAGWYEPELSAAGVDLGPPRERLARLAETVEVLKGVLGGERFRFAGRYHRVDGAIARPGPVQKPRPPVWVGGRGDRLIELVAAHADGWNTAWTLTPEDHGGRLHVLERACDRVGRDPGTVSRSVGLYALVGESAADLTKRFERLRARTPPGVLDAVGLAQWRQGHLVGTVSEVAEQLDRWAGLGVSSLVARLGAVPFAVTDSDDLDVLAAAAAEAGLLLSPDGVRS